MKILSHVSLACRVSRYGSSDKNNNDDAGLQVCTERVRARVCGERSNRVRGADGVLPETVRSLERLSGQGGQGWRHESGKKSPRTAGESQECYVVLR